MYKTVRHGENSLQYKILAQQEEGITNIKCKKSPKGKTAGIVTIILLLICGVIATAVLVPLVLTNNFITLTGTFQKFSVSTLRRSHSGNHVVVIAKKPHGWNSSHLNVLTPPARPTNPSTNSIPIKEKDATSTSKLFNSNVTTLVTHSTSPTTTQTQMNINDKIVINPKKEVPDSRTTKSVITVSTIRADGQDTEINLHFLNEFTSPSSVWEEENFKKALVPNVQEIPGTVTPQYKQYNRIRLLSFDSPNWVTNKITTNLFSAAIGGISAVSVTIIMIIVLMKSLPNRKKVIEKESAELKEDKTSLLKPSSRASDEE